MIHGKEPKSKLPSAVRLQLEDSRVHLHGQFIAASHKFELKHTTCHACMSEERMEVSR